MKTVLYSICVIFHSHQQCMKLLICPCPHQHLSFSFFFLIAILMGVKWHLIMILVWIPLMISDVKCHLLCLLAICMYFLEKCLFKSCVHFCLFVFGCSLSVWKFPGQGSNLSCSCDLCHRCSDIRSLTHCTRMGIKPMPLQRCWILNPLYHSRNSLCFFLATTCGVPGPGIRS